MIVLRFLVVLIISLTLPAIAASAGKHEGLNCTSCHGIHTAKGPIIVAVAPNTKAINPKTKKPYPLVTAICLGCHETPERGGLGILAVSAHVSHPYGIEKVNPKVAIVPAAFLREGRFECIGCHDPHPSNPYYKYLRVDTAKGAKMQDFCAMCHPMKADPKAVKETKIFDSMDERKFVAPAPPVAPALPKK
ncbi:MAG: cytochrome c3 family protein [Nitrospirota bacterium]